MARIRTIKPEFPQSESMGRVSRESRLLFIMLWTLADDAGRLRGNSRMLASLLYPYDDDARMLIDGWMSELDDEGCLVRYEIGGDTYVQICNWLKHQKIDKPSKSKIEEFDESSRILANPRERSSGDQGSKDLRTKGSEDQGSKDRIAESGKPPPAPPKSPKASFDYSTGRFENLSSEMVQAWSESCPAIDVRLEIAKAKAWLLANPKNRKSNIERFLNTWLTKAQDKAPRANGNGQHQQTAQQRVDNSAAGRVRANIAAARAARGEVDRTDLGPDVVDVRPQVGEQLRGSGGPGQGMGSVLEGDFTRAD